VWVTYVLLALLLLAAVRAIRLDYRDQHWPLSREEFLKCLEDKADEEDYCVSTIQHRDTTTSTINYQGLKLIFDQAGYFTPCTVVLILWNERDSYVVEVLTNQSLKLRRGDNLLAWRRVIKRIDQLVEIHCPRILTDDEDD
jgi:hypothetical protein